MDAVIFRMQSAAAAMPRRLLHALATPPRARRRRSLRTAIPPISLWARPPPETTTKPAAYEKKERHFLYGPFKTGNREILPMKHARPSFHAEPRVTTTTPRHAPVSF
jgi:hypothetical protein